MRFTRTLILCVVFALLCVPGAAQDPGPANTVSAFLSAWSAKDMVAMWNLLSYESQIAYPQDVFINRYTVANTAMSFESLTHTVKSTKIQGLTAAVEYDVVITTSTFGLINDPNRTMRLVNREGRWGVAWSSMDIFAELPSIGELTSDGRLKPRAAIYDRNGDPIASSGTITTLYAVKQNMSGGQNYCKSLFASILRRPYAAFDQLFASYITDDADMYIGQMSQSDFLPWASELTNACGVWTLETDNRRAYYGSNAVAHAVGYLGQITAEQQADYVSRGYAIDDLIGQSGVERMFERTLAGTPDRVLRITEPGGTVLREFATTGGVNPTPVQMTIDRDLQLAVAQAMADAYDYAYGNWGNPVLSSEGSAIVLDVKTGEILALVSYPLFDPLLFDPALPQPNGRLAVLQTVVSDTRRPLRNHAIEDRYTPGSTYKLATAVAVMAEGLIAPGETFDCQYEWYGREFGDDRDVRTDWRNDEDKSEFPPAGIITPAQAIMASCNPFFYQYGALLFRQGGMPFKLAEYARALGLGPAYNVFGGTVPEAVAELDNPSAASLAISVSVGQRDVAIPPIQMAALVATIANGGTVYKPHIVKQVGGFDGTPVTQTFTPEVINTFDFDPAILEEVREGMCGATTDEFYGTAYIRFLDAPYVVCGKTGTAQTMQNAHAWFVSYAPADDPQIAVVVVNSLTLHGSQVSAPIARRIYDYYFGVEPRRVKEYPPWWNTDPFQPLVIPDGSTGG